MKSLFTLLDVADEIEEKYGDETLANRVREASKNIDFKNHIREIVDWNKERLLHKQEFKPEVEIVNILEELIETTGEQSDNAREKALAIYDMYFKNATYTDTEAVDAFADIIVFATGAILKLKYHPGIVMSEVIKEISSRTGEIVDGKFVKDKSPEAKAKWYKADFNKAKLDG